MKEFLKHHDHCECGEDNCECDHEHDECECECEDCCHHDHHLSEDEYLDRLFDIEDIKNRYFNLYPTEMEDAKPEDAIPFHLLFANEVDGKMYFVMAALGEKIPAEFRAMEGKIEYQIFEAGEGEEDELVVAKLDEKTADKLSEVLDAWIEEFHRRNPDFDDTPYKD